MYVFDNAAEQTAARFVALARLFDEGTIRHIEARGIRHGWHCLEIGGGGGSIAAWLAQRVGPEGRVPRDRPRHAVPRSASSAQR